MRLAQHLKLPIRIAAVSYALRRQGERAPTTRPAAKQERQMKLDSDNRAVADSGLRRRRTDHEDAANDARADCGDDALCLLRLVQRLQRCAASWNVQPGCEVHVDLRQAMALARWRGSPRH
jgi:hypothetical protein